MPDSGTDYNGGGKGCARAFQVFELGPPQVGRLFSIKTKRQPLETFGRFREEREEILTFLQSSERIPKYLFNFSALAHQAWPNPVASGEGSAGRFALVEMKFK